MPRLMQQIFGLPIIEGYRALLILTAGIGLATVAVVMPVREPSSAGANQPNMSGASGSPRRETARSSTWCSGYRARRGGWSRVSW